MEEHLKLNPQELAESEAKYMKQLEDSDSDDESDASGPATSYFNSTEDSTNSVSHPEFWLFIQV